MKNKQNPKKEKPVDLSKLTITVVDRKVNTHIAQFLSRYWGRVKYYNPGSEIYPRSSESQIGKGLPGVEWIDNLNKHKKKTDVFFFPYIYDESTQADLRDQGYPVCGAGRGARMELDKYYYYDMLEKAGLPVAHTYRAEGLEDAFEYSLKNEHRRPIWKYEKKWRGDFESFAWKNRWATRLLVNETVQRVGPQAAQEMMILCQDYVEGFETGVDPFRLNEAMPSNSCLGFEVKDCGYLAKVFPEFPEIVRGVLDAIGPIYKALGYRGAYSNEMRIDAKGRVYLIDDTTRVGCPVGGCVPEMYGESWARAVYDLAHGVMPTLVPEFKYGAEIKLNSPWHIENKLHVGCPKGFEKHLKLQCSTYEGGQYYCIPDAIEGSMDFGSVAGFANTRKDAEQMALDAIGELEVYQLQYDKSVFQDVDECVEEAAKVGIEF